jgi:hypothetical protein
MEWQVITKEQASELEDLGITEASENVWEEWVERGAWYVQHKKSRLGANPMNAYNLSEIAVMLGYTFVKSNVKEAADQLIHELKVGSSTAKDCNARLKEAKQQSFNHSK